LDEEITPFKNAQLQRVPLLVKVPGMEGRGTVDEYAGQMDVMPTLLHLVGIHGQDYIQFGTDLFSEEHKDFVPFRNGDFITPEFSMIQETFFDTKTGEQLEETEEMIEMRYKVRKELDLSDKMLNGDLLRFYSPTEDWEPVNPSDYSYGNKDQSETDNK